jgi:hypothetical protein
MLAFPESFIQPDGRFRDVIPADFVPVLYITVDGYRRCATCVNGVAAFLDPLSTNERAWMVVDYELLYDGPAETCEHCQTAIATLHGEGDDPHGDDDTF